MRTIVFRNSCAPLSRCPIRAHRVLAAALLLGLATPGAYAEVFELFPTGMTSDCNEELENVWNSASPGDEIVLNAGIYAQGCRRAVGANGTPGNPIVIRAADGADVLVTRPEATSTSHNNIEISGSHMVIRGLRFQYGSAGVSFQSGSNNVTFEDNEIFDTYDNALRLNSGSTDSFVIRNNHIHHTGLGGSTGEGMYIGCHSGNCVASNHLIEGNHIHDLRSMSGGGNDGIEIKYRSHSNIIRDNLIYNTTIGQDFPCIFVYGHGTGGPNIIENNFVYNCGEAILVTADAIVRNNIVLSSTVNGIHINRQHPTPSVKNVTVVNNTVYGTHPVCARLNVGSGTDVTVANNAFFCAGSTAVSGNTGGATILNNYVSGGMTGSSIDNLQFFAGGSAENAFADPGADDFHLHAASVLVDAGNDSVPDLPATDYDDNARSVGAAIDVGAFEFDDTNGSGDPDVSLSVDDALVDAGDDVTLSWTVSDATGCAASSSPPGVWAGSIAPQAGSQLIANLQADVTFSLSCDNANGSTTRSVSVTVEQPPPDPVPTLRVSLDPETIDAGGSSLLTWTSSDATACEGVSGIAGVLATSGVVNVSPAATTNYTIRCTGPGGAATATAKLTVVLAPDEPTLDLTVDPTDIMATESALLSWSSTNATACEGLAGIGGSLALNGSTVVSPAATTTYTVRCTGPGGAATANATLTVTPLPPPPDDDTDDDGLPDSWELANFGGLGQMPADDPDNDGFDNMSEFQAGTDPADSAFTPLDTDGDGMPDADELVHFGDLSRDGTGDADGDGITDAEEIANGTDPNLDQTPPDDPDSSGGGATGPDIVLWLFLLLWARAVRRRR